VSVGSAIADGFNGCVIHLANHDVTFSGVARAVQAARSSGAWAGLSVGVVVRQTSMQTSMSRTSSNVAKVEYNYRRGRRHVYALASDADTPPKVLR
jgi:predicted dithiol-disulfide oxidoreductase (DUF899 family)